MPPTTRSKKPASSGQPPKYNSSNNTTTTANTTTNNTNTKKCSSSSSPSPSSAKSTAPPTMAPSVASRKRKLDTAAQKFYAVRCGHKTGIFLTWPECQRQIVGFKGSQFKSFDNRADAEAFVQGKTPPGERRARRHQPPDKFYAVAIGIKPGIYTDWSEAQLAFDGANGAKYKRFPTFHEAANYIRTFGDEKALRELAHLEAKVPAFVVTGDGDAAVDTDDVPKADLNKPPSTKRARLGNPELITTAQLGAPTPEKNLPRAGMAKDGTLAVFTDGSSRGNGRKGAIAGFGVYFGPGDSRNVSEPLLTGAPTNQRAELAAILRALEIVPLTQPLHIVSDSDYAAKCATVWGASWEKKGWKTSNGADVQNQDLIRAIRARLHDREDTAKVTANGKAATTKFLWVKGHGENVDNAAADRLAVAGAMGAR